MQKNRVHIIYDYRLEIILDSIKRNASIKMHIRCLRHYAILISIVIT